jgi:hypothetical protein
MNGTLKNILNMTWSGRKILVEYVGNDTQGNMASMDYNIYAVGRVNTSQKLVNQPNCLVRSKNC